MPRASVASSAVLALLSASVSAHMQPLQSYHHRIVRRAVGSLSSVQPTYLASASLTSESGCAQFYVTGDGDSCATILAAVPGLTDTILANANPSLDCSTSLAAGVGYCVGGPTTALQFGSPNLVAVRRRFAESL